MLVIAAHDGDWQGGAAIYRSWAGQALAGADCPEWFRHDPSWAWVGMKGQHAPTPERTFAEVPAEAQAVAQVGVETIHLASYFEHGHDTHYPFFRAGDRGGCSGMESSLIRVWECLVVFPPLGVVRGLIPDTHGFQGVDVQRRSFHYSRGT